MWPAQREQPRLSGPDDDEFGQHQHAGAVIGRTLREKRLIVKTLAIDMAKLKPAKPGAESEGETANRRLHMCRGRMADYRKGKGLFGKYNGQFWIPQHVRGTTKYGKLKRSAPLVLTTLCGVDTK